MRKLNVDKHLELRVKECARVHRRGARYRVKWKYVLDEYEAFFTSKYADYYFMAEHLPASLM